jgi:uncharacterized protein (UPF0262 family)
MSLRDIEIDPATWDAGSEARQIEWEANIQELLEPGHAVVAAGGAVLAIAHTEQQFALTLKDQAGAELAQVNLLHHALREGIQEYVDIVRQIAGLDQEGGGVARLEVLDMAKKATHDKIARLLKRDLRPLGVDHDTARRLFTLLLSIRVDTTRLHGVHGHRRIG